MRIFILCCALLFILSTEGLRAKVIFDWSNTDVSNVGKTVVESKLREVAKKYLDEGYAPLGPLNFYEAEEEYIIAVDPSQSGRSHSTMGSARGSSILFLSLDVASDLPALGATFAHELSHMYDITMVDRLSNLIGFVHFPRKWKPRISARERLSWTKRYIYDSEKKRNSGEYRALDKEEEYIDSKKASWDPSTYNRLKSLLLKARRALGNQPK